MDVSEYECGIRQEENKKMKPGESFAISTDSGYDSIYNGCTSLLMEKSFNRESFDIFSPNSANQTPSKQISALKYHNSTPKSNAPLKRHLFTSISSCSKRSKSENNENEPWNVSRCEVQHETIAPPNTLKVANKLERQHSFSISPTIQKAIIEVLDNKHSTYRSCKENLPEHVLMPERPLKSHQYFKPLVIHSKRRLVVPVKETVSRTFCNGTRFLNIICKLERFPTILGTIFNYVDNEDLFNMSMVSRNWNRIIKSNCKANVRTQHYLNESRNFKENQKEPVKILIAHKERHPFGQSNLIESNRISNTSPVSNTFRENQSVVQKLSKNEKLVKCPRCSKGSIVTDCSDGVQINSSPTRVPATAPDLLSANYVSADWKSTTTSNTTQKPTVHSKPSYYGSCTGLACGYLFCLKCLCDYHPGQNCKLSEPESPSKLVTCRKKSKLKSKPVCKPSSKPLRRLNFL